MSSMKRSRCASTRDASKKKLSINNEKENVTIRRRIKSDDCKGGLTTQKEVKNEGNVSSSSNTQKSIYSNTVARRPFAVVQEEAGISNVEIAVSNFNDKPTVSSTTTTLITIPKTSITKETITKECKNKTTQISSTSKNVQNSTSRTKKVCDSQINFVAIDPNTFVFDSKHPLGNNHEAQKNIAHESDNHHSLKSIRRSLTPGILEHNDSNNDEVFFNSEDHICFQATKPVKLRKVWVNELHHSSKSTREDEAKYNEEMRVKMCAMEPKKIVNDCLQIWNNTDINKILNSTVNERLCASTTACLLSSPPIEVDRTNITVRRSLTPGLLELNDSNSDEIFFDSEDHICFQATKPVKLRKVWVNELQSQQIRSGFMSPIKPNLFTKSTTIILNNLPEKPAQKTTLAHRMPHKRKVSSAASLVYIDLYTSEYLEDIIKYSLENDRKYLLKNINNAVSSNARECVLNWLHKVQNYFKLPTPVILISVRLFDSIISDVEVPINMYQLVAVATLWIIDKYENNSVSPLSAKKLIHLCGSGYTIRQLLKMEHKVLKFSNFDYNIPEPTLYVSYYMKYLDKLDDKLRSYAHYLLELFTLAPEYSTVTPSMQAAAAFYLSSKIYSETDLWPQLRTCLIFYEHEHFKFVCESMKSQRCKTCSDRTTYCSFVEKYDHLFNAASLQ